MLPAAGRRRWPCVDGTIAAVGTDDDVRRLNGPATEVVQLNGRMYPLEDIRASGAMMAFGSDWLVSTPNVFQELQVAVTRVSPWTRETPAWSPAQRMDLPAARRRT